MNYLNLLYTYTLILKEEFSEFVGLKEKHLLYMYSTPKQVIVEDKPTAQKGGIEPDLFCIFKESTFWIEIQRNQYSEQKMQAKINLREEFFFSDEWKALQ